MDRTSRSLAVNGLDMWVTEQGRGPLVLLCHGWPETAYSWRHQIPALAAAGYRVVAPDMRGFGRTTAPEAVAAYTIFHLVGDMVALVAALGETRAAIVGHDWGAHVAWSAALFRPDLFPAVAALSVPPTRRARSAPLDLLRQGGVDWFYWHYFQEPGVAEAEFERDVDATLRAILLGRGMKFVMARGDGFLDGIRMPATPPAWISEAELAEFVASYRRTGFRGGLNWYRNIDRNWELTAPWQDARILPPALFAAGSHDGTISGPVGEKHLAGMDAIVPNLRSKLILDGAGHWLQQEKPAEINAALIAFLAEAAR